LNASLVRLFVILKVPTMTALKNLKIDQAILSVTGPSWRKVALVISKVGEAMGGDLVEGDAGYDLVADHIQVLVRDGRSLARGDIKNWRHSEVRKPD
jgi:hypothetical protein